MIIYYLRLLLLLFYLIMAAQGIFYLFAVKKAFSGISMAAFAEQCKAIDVVITHWLR